MSLGEKILWEASVGLITQTVVHLDIRSFFKTYNGSGTSSYHPIDPKKLKDIGYFLDVAYSFAQR